MPPNEARRCQVRLNSPCCFEERRSHAHPRGCRRVTSWGSTPPPSPPLLQPRRRRRAPASARRSAALPLFLTWQEWRLLTARRGGRPPPRPGSAPRGGQRLSWQELPRGPASAPRLPPAAGPPTKGRCYLASRRRERSRRLSDGNRAWKWGEGIAPGGPAEDLRVTMRQPGGVPAARALVSMGTDPAPGSAAIGQLWPPPGRRGGLWLGGTARGGVIARKAGRHSERWGTWRSPWGGAARSWRQREAGSRCTGGAIAVRPGGSCAVWEPGGGRRLSRVGALWGSAVPSGRGRCVCRRSYF